MFRISIIKNAVVTNQAQFEDMDKLNTWLSNEESKKAFGQPEVWGSERVIVQQAVYADGEPILIKDAVLDENGVEIEPAQYEIHKVLVTPEVIEDRPILITPADYTKQIDDISLEVAAIEQKKLNKKLAMERIKVWKKENMDSATTIAGLKSQLKDLMTDLVEIMKD